LTPRTGVAFARPIVLILKATGLEGSDRDWGMDVALWLRPDLGELVARLGVRPG
jgi:hypothetical protein